MDNTSTENDMWELEGQFIPDRFSGYDPTSVDLWVMKFGFIFPNLYGMGITCAETPYRKIEIDYEKAKYRAIRVYRRK